MIESVAGWILRHRMFAPECRVGVAVSGGADSVCLLKVLLALAPRWNLRLRVLHLDHGLRGAESHGDAVFVQQLAAEAGLPCDLRAADVAARGGNLEQAARQARREFYLERLRSGVVDRVATGHTRDDQAETVLFRFLRGSGTAGLAGIRALTPDGIARPLLDVARADIRAWLSQRGIPWREDSSNQERRFARNRIRLDLLPALERDWNPALRSALVQVAELAREEEDYWTQEVGRLAGEHLRRLGTALLVNSRVLMRLPAAAARRLIRHAILALRGDLSRLEFQHVEAVLELARKSGGHGRLLLPGVEVWRSFSLIRFSAAGQESPKLPNVVWNEPDSPCTGDLLDADLLPGELCVRCWQPGDAIMPAGSRKELKIKDLFQSHRVPCWERPTWPILTSGGRIVWTRRFGPDARFAAGPHSRRRIVVREATAGEEFA